MRLTIVFCLCVASVLAVPFVEKRLVQKHSHGRIVGGILATDKQFPFQVAVYYDTVDASFFCGGSLIDSRYVLTAAHCVYQAIRFTLQLGSNSLSEEDPNRVILRASYKEVHPDFNPETLENDIGIIRIDSGIELNDYIQVIPLTNYDVGEVPVRVSGWGAAGDWDGASLDLLYVDLKTINNTYCKEIYGEATVTDGMVCAVGPNIEGICNGDSGGPLISDDGTGRKVQVGIASWASAVGCETNHPSGYTRTRPYADWLSSVIHTNRTL